VKSARAPRKQAHRAREQLFVDYARDTFSHVLRYHDELASAILVPMRGSAATATSTQGPASRLGAISTLIPRPIVLAHTLESHVYTSRRMRHLALALGIFFWKLGGPGLLLLGILDSSFLFAPLGNDLLVVAMSARARTVHAMLYYAFMSTIGSVLGCLLVDVVLRRAGEKGLEKHLPRKRLDYVKRKVEKNAAWALILASILPPPFPFTPFIMGAAALQYPRWRMASIVGIARMFRFTVLGVLALLFGKRFLQWVQAPALQWSLIGLIVVCTVGSVISVVGWIRRGRSPHSPQPAVAS
jgi:membrane protein YqaA with SNARE-associated domain